MDFANINFEYIAIVVIIVFFSMVLHEVMHGLVALWLGDTTAKDDGRLTLNPFKHIDPFLTILLPVILAIAGLPIFGGAKPVPFRPDKVKGGDWGAALVGIAGPLTNLFLAFIFFAVLVLFDVRTASLIEEFLDVGIMVNLGFFAFNILPIPPLDGSRVIYAIAPPRIKQAMESIEHVGLIVVFAVVMLASPFIGFIVNYIVQFVLMIFSRIFGVNVV